MIYKCNLRMFQMCELVMTHASHWSAPGFAKELMYRPIAYASKTTSSKQAQVITESPNPTPLLQCKPVVKFSGICC